MPRCKYLRPCDLCLSRKVRCDDIRPCTRCVKKGVECTLNRVRKKCGPKRRESLKGEITLEEMAPALTAFRENYYAWWPVVDVSQVLSELANEYDPQIYAMALAVCAAITRKLDFVPSHRYPLPATTHADFLAMYLDVRPPLAPLPYLIVTSLFLWVYYINMPNGTTQALVYLREAVSLSHALGLHFPATYAQGGPRQHLLRKIWYSLIITDRFMCIADGFPIVMGHNRVPMPDPVDEPDPLVIVGFNTIAAVFCSPDPTFFDIIAEYGGFERASNPDLASVSGCGLGPYHLPDQGYPDPSLGWLELTQRRLDAVDITLPLPEVLAVNVLLLKYWMKLVAWNLARVRHNLSEGVECLLADYPTTLAYRLLASTAQIPSQAFESNGPGVVVKLLGIAASIANSITDNALANLTLSYNKFLMLYLVFSLVLTFKTDIKLPASLYRQVEQIVGLRPIPRAIEDPPPPQEPALDYGFTAEPFIEYL